MSSLKVLEPLFRFLPEVKSPVHHEDFNEKLFNRVVCFKYSYPSGLGGPGLAYVYRRRRRRNERKKKRHMKK